MKHKEQYYSFDGNYAISISTKNIQLCHCRVKMNQKHCKRDIKTLLSTTLATLLQSFEDYPQKSLLIFSMLFSVLNETCASSNVNCPSQCVIMITSILILTIISLNSAISFLFIYRDRLFIGIS